MAEPDDRPDSVLGDKLEELEALLENGENKPDVQMDNNAQGNIPILDEPVTSADFDDKIPVLDDIVYSRDKFADLADRLEQKFMYELDQLVQLLKGNLKHSIMKEIRKELAKQDTDDQQPDTENDDLQQ